jgi:hypothetical protein
MKLDLRHGFGPLAVCFALGLASACGESKEGSLLEQGAGGDGSGATGTGGKQPVLGVGGADGLALGGDGTGSGQGGDGNCGSTRLEAALPNVLLVVDKSLSMKQTPPGFDSNKWDALYTALEATFADAEANINFGLDVYPAIEAETCEMPSTADIVVPIQSGAPATILSEIENTTPSGGTPTAAALARALEYFENGEGAALKGEKFVLLATDGGPNCNTNLSCDPEACTLNIENKCPANTNCCDPVDSGDPDGREKCLDEDASMAAVAALAEKGIKTFVVGIPGTEAYAATLDLLAAESGVTNPDAPPDYFAVTADGSGAGGLSDVLKTITTELIRSCRLELEENPPALRNLFVVVDGVEAKRDDPDGWQLVDDNDPTTPPIVELTGALCEQVENEGVEYINISYGCPDFEPH